MGNIHRIRLKTRCLEIHHLFFDDDSLFFITGSTEKARNLRGVIEHYCQASGQKVNFSKSSIYFNSTAEDTFKREVTEVFRVQRVSDPGFYLGLPTIWGRLRKEALDYLKERIWNKIQSWRNCLFNHAGKEVLIKAIVTVIPTYVMNVFKLPTTWCANINAMITRFFFFGGGK